ncbi:helix-turn-helix domain-containing protein [Bacillus subtilis]|nr:helix-turn-helix transcriptional regulator [Bacillus subtilis]WEZ00413.1 helix-turn-helix transcriptional regulator [Bacillus subtilis]
MKSNLCHGFMYETEEELRVLVGIEEYLDMEFDKGNGDWEPDWDDDNDAYELPTSLAMDVFCKRKAEGLTQRELARKLGIGLETLSKIEKGHENLSSKVKIKIFNFLNNEDTH